MKKKRRENKLASLYQRQNDKFEHIDLMLSQMKRAGDNETHSNDDEKKSKTVFLLLFLSIPNEIHFFHHSNSQEPRKFSVLIWNAVCVQCTNEF